MRLLLPIKILIVFKVLKVVGNQLEISENKEFSDLSQALSIVAVDVLAHKMSTIPTINLLTVENQQKFKLRDFVEEVLSKSLLSITFALRLESTSRMKVINRRRRLMNILVVENFGQFEEIYSKLSPALYKYNGHYPHYLFVFMRAECSEIEEIFNLFWKLRMYNVNVMHKTKKMEILVKTFIPFNDKNCNDTKAVLVNKFLNGSFMNGTKNFYLQKMDNFHGCSVNVAIAKDVEPFLFVKLQNNMISEVRGRDFEVIKSLSESLNFTVRYSYIESQGNLFANGSATGAVQTLLDNSSDLSISDWWLRVNHLNHLDATLSYVSDHLILVVPPGQQYTDFEKLVYPFAAYSWILVVLSLVFGFFVIFVVTQMSKNIKDFIFGSNIRHPSMNLLIGFIGGSQTSLPTSNFARYLLMMFLINSLVIRTLYQGSFFQLLQSNQRHLEVQSIDEMIEKDFKLYVAEDEIDSQMSTVMGDR